MSNGIKILNLYACLGGNRYKWGDNHIITAVENDPDLASLYQDRFPSDRVIVTDAHQYLIDHYKEYDFIWSSPPCPTHSRFNISMKNKRKMKYPDMALYQEIIFLQHYFQGKYVVENVIPFYDLLIEGNKRGRHVYWSNFKIPRNISKRKNPDLARTRNIVSVLSDYHDYDFSQYKGIQPKSKIARNLVDYEAGKSILDAALNVMNQESANQIKIF